MVNLKLNLQTILIGAAVLIGGIILYKQVSGGQPLMPTAAEGGGGGGGCPCNKGKRNRNKGGGIMTPPVPMPPMPPGAGENIMPMPRAPMPMMPPPAPMPQADNRFVQGVLNPQVQAGPMPPAPFGLSPQAPVNTRPPLSYSSGYAVIY